MKEALEISIDDNFLLEKETLSDGSIVFNVVIKDSKGTSYLVCHEATTEKEARILYNALTSVVWDIR